MNATEKRSILETNGYRLEDKKGYMPRYRWFDNTGRLIIRDDSFAYTTDTAYQHYLDTQAQEIAAAPVADAVTRVDFMKFKIGDKVRVKSLLPKTYTIIEIDANAVNSYLVDTDGGYWYHEESLTLAAPVADAPQVEAPASDSDKAYIERLEQERQDWQLAVHGLQAQLQKANADLSAAQETAQALRNENAELRKALQADTPMQAPVSEVTLTDDEIEWIAKHEKDAYELMVWAIRNAPKNQHVSAHEYYHGLLNRKETLANRAAIQRRRVEMGLS